MARALEKILVVSDMDGTLLNDAKEILPCNLESIRLFTSLGGRFTVATGRTVESISRYSQLLGMLSPVIACGGSVMYDFKIGQSMYNHFLPRMIARRAVFDIIQAVPGIGAIVTASDHRHYQVAGGPWAQRLLDEEHLSVFVRPAPDLPLDWTKVVFCGTAELIEEAQQFVENHSYPGVYFVTSSKLYLELLPEGITKGSALAALGEVLGLSLANTIAIGNYYNDLEMMEAAGRSVAVQNAPAEVRVAADEVCGDNNNGGVGQYLYELIRRHG